MFLQCKLNTVTILFCSSFLLASEFLALRMLPPSCRFRKRFYLIFLQTILAYSSDYVNPSLTADSKCHRPAIAWVWTRLYKLHKRVDYRIFCVFCCVPKSSFTVFVILSRIGEWVGISCLLLS